MGLCPISKMSTNEEDEYKKLLQKVRILQQEIAILMNQRAEENEAYEREVLAFTLKEAEWRKERKKLRKELKRLQRKDECYQLVEVVSENEKNQFLGQCCVEKMRQERDVRDEAVEKWKMLYLAIKNELDDLIQRTTYQGGLLYLRAEEEELMEEIQKEISAKDETIEVLQAKVASMEEEEYKRKREIDILRQSLRIVCSKNKN